MQIINFYPKNRRASEHTHAQRLVTLNSILRKKSILKKKKKKKPLNAHDDNFFHPSILFLL